MVNGLEGGPLRPAIFFEKSDRYQQAGLDYPVQWSPTLETLAITNLLWLILDGPNQPLIWPWALINKLMSFSISYIRRRVCFCSMVYLDQNVVIHYPKRSRLMQWYFRWIITEGLLRAISLIGCPNVDTSHRSRTPTTYTLPLELFSRVTGAGGLFNPKEGIIRGWLGQKPFVIIYQHKLAEVIWLPCQWKGEDDINVIVGDPVYI